MQQFDELLAVADRLNGPDGCPWDKKQTFYTLQPYVLEEAHEVLEAVDAQDDKKIAEELGDLLYTVVFYAKLAEKEGRFSMREIIESIKEKLIRRHPHIFGEIKLEHPEEVIRQWDLIKKQEGAHADRKSAVDGIPKTLPSLVKAQKLIDKISKAGKSPISDQAPITEEGFAEELMTLIARASASAIDAESALRRALAEKEADFRAREI